MFDIREIMGTIGRQTGGRYRPLSEEGARELLKAYFNNKMTSILFLLQKRHPKPDSLTLLKAVVFFDDLYRHMLHAGAQREYGRSFQWLILFFRRFPHVKPRQKARAFDHLRRVYRAFGITLREDLERETRF